MVLTSPSEITVGYTSGVSRYYQTAQVLKNYIIRQKLQPNSKLPTVRQMVQTLGICEATINRALGLIEQQGFIERHPGKGIFVADRSGKGEIAVVVRGEFLGTEASPFYGRTCSAIYDALHHLNPNWHIRLHLGKPIDDSELFYTTLDLLEHDIITRLRGVITFHSLGTLNMPLANQGIPVVLIGLGEGPYRVYVRRQSSIRMGLSHLKERGCKTIGILCRVTPVASKIKAIRESVDQAVCEFGLAIPEPWLAVEEGTIDERAGYEQFMRLWKNPVRPEGLMVLDDVMCRGVLRAALQLGVDLPGTLRLITTSSKGFKLPYHKQVSRVDIDHEALACEAVKLLQTVIGGDTVSEPEVWIEPQLVVGETT